MLSRNEREQRSRGLLCNVTTSGTSNSEGMFASTNERLVAFSTGVDRVWARLLPCSLDLLASGVAGAQTRRGAIHP